MNNKEFEDFFKDLDPNEKTVPQKTEADDDLVFSSFFEDATSSAKKTPAEKPLKEEFIFED